MILHAHYEYTLKEYTDLIYLKIDRLSWKLNNPEYFNDVFFKNSHINLIENEIKELKHRLTFALQSKSSRVILEEDAVKYLLE